jgi:hypothetical protein
MRAVCGGDLLTLWRKCVVILVTLAWKLQTDSRTENKNVEILFPRN